MRLNQKFLDKEVNQFRKRTDYNTDLQSTFKALGRAAFVSVNISEAWVASTNPTKIRVQKNLSDIYRSLCCLSSSHAKITYFEAVPFFQLTQFNTEPGCRLRCAVKPVYWESLECDCALASLSPLLSWILCTCLLSGEEFGRRQHSLPAEFNSFSFDRKLKGTCNAFWVLQCIVGFLSYL